MSARHSMQHWAFDVRCLFVLLALSTAASPGLAQETIILSEIVGNGDGRPDSAVPGVVGINSDTGLFETAHFHATITNTPPALQPVDANDFIDSVFIIDAATIPINSAGVQFTFGGNNVSGGTTWNHILRNATHDFDKGFADVFAGGIDAFNTGVGIHAAAGITFDLTALRAEFGAANVRWFSCFAGHDRCSGCAGAPIDLFVIQSNGDEIVHSHALRGVLGPNGGEPVILEIPSDANFLTLACGANDGSICCDHGVFADAVISSVPLPSGVRAVSSPGNPGACPPTAGGPVSVTITQEGSGAEMVRVTERAFGTFGANDVTAQNGGVVSTLVPAAADTMTSSGFIKAWLLLGPFSQSGGAAPGEDAIRFDYLTDGVSVNEEDVLPKAGDTVNTDYNGAAASTGLAVFNGINPNAVPTWAQWIDTDDTINFNDFYDGDVNNIMMYAVCYLRVENDTSVDLCLGSDDSVQVLLDDTEIFILNAGRGWGASEQCQNTIPDVPLEAGVHRLMLKIFEGGGGHGFRLGIFEPGTRTPAEGIGVCLDPAGGDPCPLDPTGVQIAWNVSRNQLAAGVSYSINIDVGRTTFRGDIESRAILGTSRWLLIPNPTKHGPLSDFEHAHNIGRPCPGTRISEPVPGTVTIAGAGEDIWQNGDQFMYAYKAVTGDFSARATIVDREFAPGSRWGKHGIMARQDCSPRSRYSFMHDHGADLQDAARFATRPTHGGADNFELGHNTILPAGTHYDTLRLDRCGNRFTGYVLNQDGQVPGFADGEWVQVGEWDWGSSAPNTVQIGLAVTSHMACALTTITFEDWELKPGCEGPVSNLSCTENASGGLDLAWTNTAAVNPALPISVQVNGVQVLSLPGTATSATIPQAQLPPGQFSTIKVVNGSGIASFCRYPVGYSTEGFVQSWLLLGPYRQPGAAFLHAAPGVDAIRGDYLRNADGSINEIDVEPKAGDTVMTDYAPGSAMSVGLVPPATDNGINPDGVPTWAAWRDSDDTIDFNGYYGGNLDSIMMYALVYIDVPQDVTVDIGLASDDAVQVLLDGEEIHINNVARGFGGANTIQDIVSSNLVSQLRPLEAGVHRLMVKVFEGGGGHGFRLRFQDPFTGLPVVPGRLLLAPGAIVPPGVRFVRGDADSNGTIELTDAIRILNFLFTGGPPPLCVKAADADDSGGLAITDAVRILNWLFISGARPAPPSPSTGNYPASDCGTDPTDDPLDCVVTAVKCR
jgi:hypothetical protein